MLVIHAIEAAGFRRLREPVRVDGLGEGLNVVAGDNEEGKSTLLEALRAALFEKHGLTGAAADRFQPFGSSLRPEVAVEFSLDGQRYRIEKGFCQRPSAELTTPTATLTGGAAEDRLRELLGFSAPGRGASRPEHQGVWGLLLVQQGTAFEPIPANELGQRTLRSALEAQVGDVLGGPEGEQLLARVRDAFERYFTPTGRPRGELRQAQEDVAALEGELAEVQRRLAEHEGKVASLERLESDLAGPLHPQRGRELQARLDTARDASRRLESLREGVARAGQALRLAEAEARAVRQRWEARQLEARRLADREAALAETRARAERAEAGLAGLETRLAAAGDASRAAHEELAAARGSLQALEARRARRELTVQAEGLRRQLQRAREAEDALREARRALAGVALPDGAIEALRELSGRLERARARLSAAATSLAIDLRLPARLDGRELRAGERVELTRPAVLDLGEAGRVAITPGGIAVGQASEEVATLERELAERLAGLGLEGLAEAEARTAEAGRLSTRIAAERATLEAVAPEGTGTTAGRLADVEGRLAALAGQLGEIDEGQAPPDDEALAAARERLHGGEAAAEQAASALEETRNERDRHHGELASARADLEAGRAEIDRLRGSLEQARAERGDEALFLELQQAEQRIAAAAEAREAAERSLEAADPEAIASDLATAERAVATFEAQRRDVATQVSELRGELRGEGQLGLGERAQALAGEWEAARLRAEAIERQAGAVGLLQRVLQEAASEARERFLQPVTERIAPLLRRLLPEDRLVLGESLDIAALDRDGVRQPFADLSVGTREQIAVLTRLAFAQLLAEQGRPAMVVLDDALVYSDRDRFERMKLILAQAARRFQILVLTCRPDDYQSLGAPTMRLR